MTPSMVRRPMAAPTHVGYDGARDGADAGIDEAEPRPKAAAVAAISSITGNTTRPPITKIAGTINGAPGISAMSASRSLMLSGSVNVASGVKCHAKVSATRMRATAITFEKRTSRLARGRSPTKL